jgi:hypothetical protein
MFGPRGGEPAMGCCPARTFRTRRDLLRACGTMTAGRGGPSRRVEQEDVHVLGSDAAYTVTRYVVTRPRPAGTAEPSPRVVSKLWARQDGVWRIVHVHESAPGRSGTDWSEGRPAAVEAAAPQLDPPHRHSP